MHISGLLSKWAIAPVGFCPSGLMCPVGFCPSGLLSYIGEDGVVIACDRVSSKRDRISDSTHSGMSFI